MKYGMIGGFIRLAFEKTAMDYMQAAFPGMDPDAYRGACGRNTGPSWSVRRALAA